MPVLDIAVNATRILQHIWMYPGISRIDLSRELNLNKSTITKIVQTLMDENLVRPASNAYITDGKGRRPTGLYLNEELGVVLGIEIRTESWNAVAVDLNGRTVDRCETLDIAEDLDMLGAIRSAITHCEARQVAEGRRVLGAGVGLSGQINPYEGVVLSSNPLKVAEPVNVFEEMKCCFPFPVVVENDANCCAWKVMMEKRAKSHRNFLCILGEFRRIGMGPEDGYSEIEGIAVGLGVVIKDMVLHGDQFSAGEFQSVFKTHENPSQFNLSFSEVAKLKDSEVLLQQVIQEMARNIALLVNVLNFTLVQVVGDIAAEADLVREALSEEIELNWLYDSKTNCVVEVCPGDTAPVATGAAAYFLNRLFSIPDIHGEYGGSYPFGLELLRLTLENSA
jgi:predicted NBD/HSP70 family sugar kinase